jgi:hypothetical protein
MVHYYHSRTIGIKKMKFSKILSTLLLSAVSITSINSSAAALECAPSVLSVVKTAPYNKLDKALTPAVVADLKTKLENSKLWPTT